MTAVATSCFCAFWSRVACATFCDFVVKGLLRLIALRVACLTRPQPVTMHHLLAAPHTVTSVRLSCDNPGPFLALQKMMGMLSVRDVVRTLVKEQRDLAREHNAFIHGSY